MSAYADSARLYLEAGWHPLPLLDNDKGEVPAGFTGYAARPVRPENVDRWARLHGDRPVCLRLIDEVGLDADNYEHGKVPAGAAATTLADGEERLGPLPLTVVVSSRFEDEDYDGVSGIRLFRLPLEYQRLAERKVWKSEVGPGVDVIRLGHRQVVVWPSKHPKRGSEYAYLDQRTGEVVHGPLPPSDTLPYLPEAWCEALLKPSKGASKKARGGSPRSAQQPGNDGKVDPGGSAFWTDRRPCPAVEQRLGHGLQAMRHGRHDGMRDNVLALTRLGEQGHAGVTAAVDRLHGAFVLSVTEDGSRSEVDAEAEWARAVDGVDAVIEADGRTPADRVGCCPTGQHGPAGGLKEGDLRSVPVGQRMAAELLAWRHMYVPGLGWYAWDGARWRPAAHELVVKEAAAWATTFAARLVTDRADRAHVSQALKYRDVGNVKQLVEAAKTAPGILVEASELDRHPHLLATPAGVVDLQSGVLMPPDPALRITKCTSVDYVPGYTHPDFDKALEALPEGSQEFMRQRLGQALTGEPPPSDDIVVARGGGENGKTALFDTVLRAVGDYGRLISDRVLLGSASNHPTELMDLLGLRLALLEETPEARRLDVARLKRTVGTPQITARHVKKDSVTFDTTHSLFISTNYLPTVDETDHGTWRRLKMVEFPYTFRATKEALVGPNDRLADPTLKHQLKGEAPRRAALAWMVSGAVDHYAAGGVLPPPPEAVLEATAAWRAETDVLLGFAADCLDFDPDTCVLGSDLLEQLNHWLVSRGFQRWSEKTLSARLSGHSEFHARGVAKDQVRNPRISTPGGSDPEVKTGRHRVWLGVRFTENTRWLGGWA